LFKKIAQRGNDAGNDKGEYSENETSTSKKEGVENIVASTRMLAAVLQCLSNSPTSLIPDQQADDKGHRKPECPFAESRWTTLFSIVCMSLTITNAKPN